ncbi:MAG: S8 family serine peptidase [Armatimonadetes bacterium]|nr:S8 family serine peptidase [Armatimonadota bacterium]
MNSRFSTLLMAACLCAATLLGGCGSLETGGGGAPAGPVSQSAGPAPAPVATAAEEISAEFAPDQVLVKFRLGLRAAEGGVEALGRQTGLSLRTAQPLEPIPGAFLVELEGGANPLDAAEQLSAQPQVEWAEPNYRWTSSEVIPAEPSFSELWGLKNTGQTIQGVAGTSGADIKATYAWDSLLGSSSIVVAVIDTGVDYNHPDLAANMWINIDEIPGNGVDDDSNGVIDDRCGMRAVDGDGTVTGDPMDDHYHGTHVAGTIAALSNGSGVVGVAPGVRIMACKFLDSTGSGWTSDAVLAVNYAVQNGAQLSNNSWGGGGYSQALYDAIQAASTQNHMFVAAAGNANRNTDSSPEYPAGYALNNVLSVGASTNKDAKASFSNYGSSSVDLFAPGDKILSTVPGNQYGYLSGTSMASPHVTGAVALIYSYFPGITCTEARTRLINGVDYKSAFDNKCVADGRLNARGALLNASDFKAPANLDAVPVSTSQVQITWQDRASQETGYELWRKMVTATTTTGYTKIQLAANTTSYLDTGLYPGTRYYYKVRAQMGTTYSAFSNQDNATTQGPQPPGPNAPSNLAFTKTLLSDGRTQIVLTWSDNASDDTGAQVQRTTGTSTATSKLKGSNKTTYSYKTATADSYTFKVRAYNLFNFSAYSNTVTVTVP